MFTQQTAPMEKISGGEGHVAKGPSVQSAPGSGGQPIPPAAVPKKKESIVDLSKYLDKSIRVKFSGGREASGILKGYDALLNLVLDNTVEYLRDADDPMKVTEETRPLGLVVCRGTGVVVISPVDGLESIPNPFIQPE